MTHQLGRMLKKKQIGLEAADAKGVRQGRSVTVNALESPLGWLLARGHVTQRQFDAGERLRADWERAQLAPGVTCRLRPPGLPVP